jgi:hypothetical protein
MYRLTPTDLRHLAWMTRCQQIADVEHTEEAIRAAARAIGAENHLPEPEQLELQPLG